MSGPAFLVGVLVFSSVFASAELSLKQNPNIQNKSEGIEYNGNNVSALVKISTPENRSGYRHVWPVSWTFFVLFDIFVK